ncbi:DUF177 domain-containing protein [Campylobacter sp. FMV-PI01]|uniref:DUF177 domain-containing protein n=1 Tax=Campylobacter portucalensis TaxID=2608384 RepID=A0A6L5WKA7_9BACT|nr:hypothetical protein [Campylobacter portucalensis]MSN96455.1 DUF177 domain-containing protein [Campylobacter portucalensis]
MKISFSKINNLPFSIERDELNFSGYLLKKSQNLVDLNGKIVGKITHQCDRCGDEIFLNLNERVNLVLSDGIYKSEILEDVIEFFDGEIDLKEVLNSEIELLKSDYFYCEKCK